MAELGEPLSNRELDVLACVAKGATNREVAHELSISDNTVKVHLRRIYAKLGVSSRTEATRVGIEKGLIALPNRTTIVEKKDAPNEPPDQPTMPPPSIRQPELDTTPQTAVPTSTPAHRWRNISIGLALLLLVTVGLFTLSRQRTNANISNLPDLTETSLGENWLQINRPMPEPTAHMATAAIGLRVYQIGGETAVGVTNAVHLYNVDAQRWETATEKPTAVADSAATTLIGEIYVLGGRTTNNQPSDVAEVYSPTQNQWRPITNLPEPILGGVALSDGTFIYLFGGWNGETYLDTAYVYDLNSENWRPLPKMPHAVAFATGGWLSNQFYVIGGFDGVAEQKHCQRFDPITEIWSICPDLLTPRSGAGSAVLVNRLYIIGGGLEAQNDVSNSEVYNPTNETWALVNTPQLATASSWLNMGVANVETRVYVIGGTLAGERTANTYVYSPFVYNTFIPSVSDQD